MKFFFAIILGLSIALTAGISFAKPLQTKYKTYEQPTLLKGVTIQGRVEYHRNDTIAFMRLTSDQTFLGQWLPANTGLHFTENGEWNWCFLGKDWEIQGHKMHGGGHEWQTLFYPSGKLHSGGLTDDKVIDGIPCAAGSFWNEVFGGGGRTYFYESGKLKYAKVAKTVTYRGQEIKKGKHVKLAEDGSILLVK
ncbi:MAG: hypothetical protein OEM52_14140 [bacterium]|nr:hypothetical protein [bacterium]